MSDIWHTLGYLIEYAAFMWAAWFIGSRYDSVMERISALEAKVARLEGRGR
jgi:hypothetical protein